MPNTGEGFTKLPESDKQSDKQNVSLDEKVQNPILEKSTTVPSLGAEESAVEEGEKSSSLKENPLSGKKRRKLLPISVYEQDEVVTSQLHGDTNVKEEEQNQTLEATNAENLVVGNTPPAIDEEGDRLKKHLSVIELDRLKDDLQKELVLFLNSTIIKTNTEKIYSDYTDNNQQITDDQRDLVPTIAHVLQSITKDNETIATEIKSLFDNKIKETMVEQASDDKSIDEIINYIVDNYTDIQNGLDNILEMRQTTLLDMFTKLQKQDPEITFEQLASNNPKVSKKTDNTVNVEALLKFEVQRDGDKLIVPSINSEEVKEVANEVNAVLKKKTGGSRRRRAGKRKGRKTRKKRVTKKKHARKHKKHARKTKK